jgi:hypothetical protein
MFPDSSSRCNIQLAPLPDSYDLDRALLLSVQAIQVDETTYVTRYKQINVPVPLTAVLCILF